MGERAAHTQRESIQAQKEQYSQNGSVLALAAVIGPEVETQVTWLQSKGLLGRNKTCPACNQPMDMQHRSDITDKYRWRCPDSSCKKSVSLRSGSFFEQSCLKLRQWIVLVVVVVVGSRVSSERCSRGSRGRREDCNADISVLPRHLQLETPQP